jgi:alpha-tubulin suppressor-like RCC1 family protein
VRQQGREARVAAQGGTLWGWGNWGLPETPTPAPYSGDPAWVGPWQTVSAGINRAVVTKQNGELWGWGDNTYGELGIGTSGISTGSAKPVHIQPGTAWQSVAAGYSHSAGVQTDGSLWT